jgi:hypothetical protein
MIRRQYHVAPAVRSVNARADADAEFEEGEEE